MRECMPANMAHRSPDVWRASALARDDIQVDGARVLLQLAHQTVAVQAAERRRLLQAAARP